MLMRIWENAVRDVREGLGWGHPGTSLMVKTFFLIVLAVTVGMTQAGCGGGQTGGGGGGILSGIGNPPGPWIMTVTINVQYPRLEQGAVARHCTVTMRYDNREPVFVAEGNEGDGSVSIPKGIGDIRPGEHTILIEMKYDDGTVAKRQAPSFAVGNDGHFTSGQNMSVNL